MTFSPFKWRDKRLVHSECIDNRHRYTRTEYLPRNHNLTRTVAEICFAATVPSNTSPNAIRDVSLARISYRSTVSSSTTELNSRSQSSLFTDIRARRSPRRPSPRATKFRSLPRKSLKSGSPVCQANRGDRGKVRAVSIGAPAEGLNRLRGQGVRNTSAGNGCRGYFRAPQSALLRATLWNLSSNLHTGNRLDELFL